MFESLEKAWNEYFAEECAVIGRKEGKALVERSVKLHAEMEKMLTEEQCEAVQKYVESVYDEQSFFVKKAFFHGCEFAISFLFEAGNFTKE